MMKGIELMFTKRIEKYEKRLKETVLGEDTIYQGNIKSSSNISIEGQLFGDIECEGDITIGPKSEIHSNIHANDVIVAGKVNGDLKIKGKLTLLNTGMLKGTISASSIVIHEGGVFHGTSSIQNQTESLKSDDVIALENLSRSLDETNREVSAV
jgi:cytoskeletal protein CcmA (bactofilin family)